MFEPSETAGEDETAAPVAATHFGSPVVALTA